ncbi:MAG: hypothetical protein D4R97_08650 [Bacteroidetes bacterium]|nr:MAG: hypothetical protein D4R97_08650 [Bacteroidota bacterium]
MQKKGISCFLAVLFFTCCCYDPGFGQAGTPGKKEDPSFSQKSTGFYNVTTFIPVTLNGQFFSGLQTICGYKVNNYLSIGGGIGYERFNSISTYEDFKADLSLLPVFVDIRYTPLTGKFSPVIAINAGYKVLLNKPSTQIRYDTVHSNVLFVEARNDYADYNTYTQGGPFITAEAGVRVMVFKRVGLYLAADYSLWSVSGTYYLTNTLDLLGSDNIWRRTGYKETTDKSLAYVHVFFVRLGICF